MHVLISLGKVPYTLRLDCFLLTVCLSRVSIFCACFCVVIRSGTMRRGRANNPHALYLCFQTTGETAETCASDINDFTWLAVFDRNSTVGFVCDHTFIHQARCTTGSLEAQHNEVARLVVCRARCTCSIRSTYGKASSCEREGIRHIQYLQARFRHLSLSMQPMVTLWSCHHNTFPRNRGVQTCGALQAR